MIDINVESTRELTESQRGDVVEISHSIADFETQIKVLKEQQERLRSELLEAMDEYDILKIETDEVDIVKVAPTDVEYFDKAKFKKENQDLYDEYVTMKQKKGYVRIKVK